MELARTERLLSGRYRLRAVIGRGGMGVVWQARDELLKRDVAVKELIWPPHLTEAERQDACRRTVREAQMAGRLSHLNVVRIYDIIEEDGHPWIVMELLPYRSLRDLVEEEGPQPAAWVARAGLGVLAALRAAHSVGVLHRDVKPANILVGTDGRVVLTDFGIARATDSSTLTTAGLLIGSPSYIAPERARDGQSSPAGDLWGLGASLYAAVEGHPPFERNAPLATLTAVVVDEPETAVRAGPLWPVISGLLRKNPDERLDAAATERMLREVASRSEDVGRSEVTIASPSAAVGLPAPPVWPRTRRFRRRRVALAALAAAAVVTATALALTSSLDRATAPPGASSRSNSHPVRSPAFSATAASTGPRTATSSPAASASPPASRTGSGSAGSGALPAGYYRFTNSTGFSIGVPDGWQISHVGHYVYITDPSNSGIFLLIDQSDTPKPNPLADWEQQAANRSGTYPDYHLIRLESVTYPQAEKAADWEFTYLRNGILVHILNRNVLANASHAYALYWSTPESDWSADYHYFLTFAGTFRPAA